MDDGRWTIAPIVYRPAHRLRRLQRVPAHEDGYLPEQALLFGGQQIVAPLDGVSEGLVTGGLVYRPASQQFQPASQPRQYVLWGQGFDPGGCQLYREGQSLQPVTYLGYDGGVGVVYHKARPGCLRSRWAR